MAEKKKNKKNKIIIIIILLLALLGLIFVFFKNTNKGAEEAPEIEITDPTSPIGETPIKEAPKASLEGESYYKYENPSTAKEGKDSAISAAVAKMAETKEAVEATPSKEDKTIVEYKKEDVSTVKADGTTKTETEIAKEVVNNAIEDSKKDDSVIIAVKTETVEESAAKAESTVEEVKENTEKNQAANIVINEGSETVVSETTATTTEETVVDSCGDLNPATKENISFED